MKKISIILFVMTLLLSFTACKNDKKAEKATETNNEVVETPVVETPVVAELTPAEALKAFQAFAKEYGEAFNNKLSDPQKYMKLAGQMQEKVADMNRYQVDFTPAQKKEFDKAMKIIRDVSSGGTKK
jgi:hypothetical protein